MKVVYDFACANKPRDEPNKYLFEIKIPKGTIVSRNLEYGGNFNTKKYRIQN